MIEKKIWLPRACLAILVLAQITVCICFGIAKGGYDIDEMLTYGLANGHNKPFLTSTPEQEDTLFLYREQVAERFAAVSYTHLEHCKNSLGTARKIPGHGEQALFAFF